MLALVALWIAYHGYTAYRELHTARSQATELRGDIVDGLRSGDILRLANDTGSRSLPSRVAELGKHTEAARSATSDPVWSSVARLPWVGNDLAVLTGIAEATDRVVRQGLGPLVKTAAGLSAAMEQPKRSGLPINELTTMATDLSAATTTVGVARARLDEASRGPHLQRLDAARQQLVEQLRGLSSALEPAAAAARLVPKMLGASEDRAYLVMFVNPAEARGGGGLVGGFALLRASAGVIESVKVGSNLDLPALSEGPTGLPVDFVSNWGQYGAETTWNESNLSGHFPYTGLLWSKMYEKATGTTIDGVLSLDPTALSVLLEGVGGVRIGPHFTVTSSNVVSFIQKDQYALPLTTRERKDALVAVGKQAVSRIEQRLAAALPKQLRGLAAVSASGHLRMWSAHPDEQAVLAEHALGGVIPATSAPFLAVVVNNAGSGKLDAYLAVRASREVVICQGSRRTVRNRILLTNRAPATGLPDYVTTRGDLPEGQPGPPPGTNRSLVTAMVTANAQVRQVTLNNRSIFAVGTEAAGPSDEQVEQGNERGHPLASIFAETPPGATTSIVVTTAESGPELPVELAPLPMAIPQALASVDSCRAA